MYHSPSPWLQQAPTSTLQYLPTLQGHWQSGDRSNQHQQQELLFLA
jgi:hypothetical protein